jgi:hypothetical protein
VPGAVLNGTQKVMHVFKGLLSEMSRDSLRARAIYSTRQRQKTNISTSLRAPFGKRILSMMLDGQYIVTHRTVPRILRHPGYRPTLVDHPEEIQQMEALRHFKDETPATLYAIPPQSDLTYNWRNPGEMLVIGNIGKNVRTYLKREIVVSN